MSGDIKMLLVILTGWLFLIYMAHSWVSKGIFIFYLVLVAFLVAGNYM